MIEAHPGGLPILLAGDRIPEGAPLPAVVNPTSAAGISKRAVDFLVSAVMIVVLAIPMLLIAVLVKADSPGPILYRSRRIGRHGRPFDMLKFRTMVVDAHLRRQDLMHLTEAPDGLFKIQNDPRLTRLGRLLRVTSLDELPQILHVLTGTMSLVGPRPLPPDEDALIAGGGLRAEARPGVTGPWQVAGSWRIPLKEMIRMDDAYISNWSFGQDLKLMSRSVLHMLRRNGV